MDVELQTIYNVYWKMWRFCGFYDMMSWTSRAIKKVIICLFIVANKWHQAVLYNLSQRSNKNYLSLVVTSQLNCHMDVGELWSNHWNQILRHVFLKYKLNRETDSRRKAVDDLQAFFYDSITWNCAPVYEWPL